MHCSSQRYDDGLPTSTTLPANAAWPHRLRESLREQSPPPTASTTARAPALGHRIRQTRLGGTGCGPCSDRAWLGRWEKGGLRGVFDCLAEERMRVAISIPPSLLPWRRRADARSHTEVENIKNTAAAKLPGSECRPS